MFGFGKKKHDKPEKKHSKLDKLIMGAIVGGAVGSVIGMSIAPQKGKDTREMIAQKGKELIKKGQAIGDKIAEAKEKIENPDDAGDIEQHGKKKLLRRMKDRIFGSRKKIKKGMVNDADFKKIPNEVE